MPTITSDVAPSTMRVPGIYVNLQVAQGLSTAGAGERTAVYIGAKLSSGTANVNTTTQIFTEDQAKTLFGAGSPLHLMIRWHFMLYRGGSVYATAYNATSGGSAGKASHTSTFSGTATKRGTAKITICGDEVSWGFSVGDLASTIAANGVAAISQYDFMPVDGSNISGALKLQAKVAGSSQGDGYIPVIPVQVEISPGCGITVASTGDFLGDGTGDVGVEGTTSEHANFVTALSAIAAVRHYYIGHALYGSSDLTAVSTHVLTKSSPDPGLRSVAVSAYNGEQASAQALAVDLNYERVQLVNHEKSLMSHAQQVGLMIAARQKYETIHSAFNFDGFAFAGLWKKSWDQTSWKTSQQMNAAINDGLSPIGTNQKGGYLVESNSTRSKNEAGTVNDTRALQTRIVSVCDDFLDTVVVRAALTYFGFRFKDDKRKADGSVDFTQELIKTVLTPSQFRPFIVGVYREFEKDGKLQNVDACISQLLLGVDPQNGGRLEVSLALQVINWLDLVTISAREISPN